MKRDVAVISRMVGQSDSGPLARLYGVETKALNQAVKRNLERFPDDSMFQLTGVGKEEAVTKCDHLSTLKYSPSAPGPIGMIVL